MADTPDVLKRLEEIERTHLAYARCEGPDFCNLAWLLNLTRALLESQGELTKVNATPVSPTSLRRRMSQPKRVRRGEL